MKYDKGEFSYSLLDDSTWDTVVKVTHVCGRSWEWRHGDAAEYRDNSGRLSLERWVESLLADRPAPCCPECDR